MGFIQERGLMQCAWYLINQGLRFQLAHLGTIYAWNSPIYIPKWIYELAAHDLSAIFYRRSQFETVYRSYGARGQIAEIYCKIIYYQMNQFEVRSNLRIWKSMIIENDFRNKKVVPNWAAHQMFIRKWIIFSLKSLPTAIFDSTWWLVV